ERWHFLAECFLGLGVVFATLAIPLALDARWTSAAWALEGAMIVWACVRQQRKLARAVRLLLQLGAGVAYASAYARMPAGPVLLDAPFVGALLVSFAGLWTYRMLANGGHRGTEAERGIPPALFVGRLVWWLVAAHHEIREFVPGEPRLNAHIGFLAATALASMLIAR